MRCPSTTTEIVSRFCLWVWSAHPQLSPSTASLTGRTTKTVSRPSFCAGVPDRDTVPVSHLGITQPTTISFEMMFPGPRAGTSSKWAAAGCSTRRSRIGFSRLKVNSSSTASIPGTTSPIICSATPLRYSESAVQGTGHWNSVSTALYFQDNYRVNKRITLNLGLRWDGIPHTYEANKQMSDFYPNLYDPADAAQLGLNYQTILPTSPGLGTSSNPILARTPHYLNGVGICGTHGASRRLREWRLAEFWSPAWLCL